MNNNYLAKIINSRISNDKNHIGINENSYREWAGLFIGGRGFTFSAIDIPPELSPKDQNFYQQKYKNYWLAHMIRDDNSIAFDVNFERLISNWDILSCSLTVFEANQRNRLISSVGFLLSVPPQNIIGAHNDDLWMPNHIGSEYKNLPFGIKRTQEAGLLAQSLLTNVNLQGPLEKNKRYRGVKMTRVLKPKQVLERGLSDHNEVLVISRRGINIHCGKPQTSKIIARAIVIVHCYRDRIKFNSDSEYYKYCWKKAEKLRRVNPDLPIFISRNCLPSWNWKFTCNTKRIIDNFI